MFGLNAKKVNGIVSILKRNTVTMSYGQSNEIVNMQFRNLLSSFQKFHEYGPQSSLQKDHDDLEKLRLKYLKAVKYALDNPTALTAEINPEPSGRSVWRLVDQNLSGQELADMIDEGFLSSRR